MRWCPASDQELSECEKSILSYFKRDHQIFFVQFKSSDNQLIKVRTLVLLSDNNENDDGATPLVLLHGLGSGLCLWSLNIESLANQRTVYAIDLIGFGRSSRIKFSSNNEEIVKQYIDSINEWRKQVKINEFILLGHSFGAFLAINYALVYSEFVKHLILSDGWGLTQPNHSSIPSSPYDYFPLWGKLLSFILGKLTPFAILRISGPFGPLLVRKFLPRMPSKFSSVVKEKGLIVKYVYLCNAQTPSGEIAFQRLGCAPLYLFAKNPILSKMAQIDHRIGIDLIFGSRSVLDRRVGKQVELIREKSYVESHLIMNAGHNIHIDCPQQFNDLVNHICKRVDKSSVS